MIVFAAPLCLTFQGYSRHRRGTIIIITVLFFHRCFPSAGGQGLGLGQAFYGSDVRAADGVGEEGGSGTEEWRVTTWWFFRTLRTIVKFRPSVHRCSHFGASSMFIAGLSSAVVTLELFCTCMF